MEAQNGGGGGGGFIWFVSCSLFISILAGGGCLMLYITTPQDDQVSMSWLAITGVALVCLPWVFWFFTFIYRLLTRMRKKSDGVAAAANVNRAGSIAGLETKTSAAG